MQSDKISLFPLPSFNISLSFQNVTGGKIQQEDTLLQVSFRTNQAFLDFQELFSYSEILSAALRQKKLLMKDEEIIIQRICSNTSSKNLFTVDCALKRSEQVQAPAAAMKGRLWAFDRNLPAPLVIDVDQGFECRIKQKRMRNCRFDRWTCNFVDEPLGNRNFKDSGSTMTRIRFRFTGFLLARINAGRQTQLHQDVVDLLRRSIFLYLAY